MITIIGYISITIMCVISIYGILVILSCNSRAYRLLLRSKTDIDSNATSEERITDEN